MNNLKIYLTEAYAIDNKSILRILTQDKQINKDDPNYNSYEKLAAWATKAGKQQKIKNIDLTAIKLSDRGLITKNKMVTQYTTLGHVLLRLKNLMDQEGRYNSENELSNLIQQTTLEILSGIKNAGKSFGEPEDSEDPEEKKLEDEDSENEEKPENEETSESDGVDTRKGRDWTAYRAQKLANANGKATSKVLSEFYDEYYSQEYAGVEAPEKDTKGIVAKLKSLDKILIPEFNKLGYNPEVNPFAQFLKILIEKKPEIFNKLNINNYGAIHNSFIDQHITGNELGNYNEGNILFCNDLYNKKGLDIVEFLDIQKQARNTGKSSDIKDLIAKIFIQQNVSGKSYNEKVKNLRELSKPIQPGAGEAKLKSELEIRELYNHLFGQKVKDRKTIDADKIVKEATDENIILDMIYHIIGKYKFEPEYETGILSALTSSGYKKNNNNIEQSEKVLSKYTNMSIEELRGLIKKLVTSYNNKKRKEAENKK